MDADERMALIVAGAVVFAILIIAAAVVTVNWRNESHHLLNQQRQLEEIRACAHAVDVTSCLRDATG